MRPFGSLGRVLAGVSTMRRTLLLVSVLAARRRFGGARTDVRARTAGSCRGRDVHGHRPRLGPRRRPEPVRRVRVRPEGPRLREDRPPLLRRDGARRSAGLACAGPADERRQFTRHRLDGGFQSARRNGRGAHRHRREVHAETCAQARRGRTRPRPAHCPARCCSSREPPLSDSSTAIAARSRSTSSQASCARSTWSGWSSTSTASSRPRCRSRGSPRR